MFGYNKINVDFLTDSPVLVLLMLALLLLLGVYLYVRTNPPVSRFRKILMGTLRVIALVALCLALLEPVLSYSRVYSREIRVAVMVDQSASMDRIENDKSRTARLDSLLSTSGFDRIRAEADVSFHYFGGNLSSKADEVDRDRTALGEAIYQLEALEMGQLSDYWLLLSDGNSNAGRDPREAARGLTQKIISVGLAGDAGGFDLGLAEIDFNPIQFVGRQSEISIRLSWLRAEGKRFNVQLVDKGKVVAQQPFTIEQEDGFGDIRLKYIPETPGRKILKIKLPTMEGDEAPGNNQRSIAVNVLKSRMPILLVADNPDYEVGFLHRFLSDSDEYDVDLTVTGDRSGNLKKRFPSRQTELNRYDLLILYDPDISKLSAHAELIQSYVAERGGAIWVIMGNNIARTGLPDWLRNLLPFYPTNPARPVVVDFHGEPSEENLFHPILRLADDRAAIRRTWSQLPPFETLVRCDGADPDGVVLAYASGQAVRGRPAPLIGYKRVGPGKVLATATSGFWRWGFVTLGYSKDNSAYRAFMSGSLTWLTVPDDFAPMRIGPTAEVYARGETIRFDGFAFDQGFRPIPQVAGIVKLQSAEQGNEGTFEADMQSLGEGRFRAEFSNLSPGEYRWTGRFEKDGRQLIENSGKLLVESFSPEEFDQRGDEAVLSAISGLSGGGYYPRDKFDQALAAMDLTRVEVESRGELVLWNRFWLLLIFVIALSLEWMLRKGNQLL